MEITVEYSDTRDSGGIFNYHFTANSLLALTVKFFLMAKI